MIKFKCQNLEEISDERFEEIYNEIKTPYKYGAVIKFDEYMADSPSVFKFNGKWYMYYVRIAYDTNISGYETHFSSSDDLINWKYEGAILKRNEEGVWDSKQCGGYGAFIDMNFGGNNEIACVNNKYYMSYLGGASDGYEPDPLHMGLAYSDSPINPDGFKKIETPILSPYDIDARRYEKKTIYKSNMLIDEDEVLGYRYINYYNSRDKECKERIYMAVSKDAEHWGRLGDSPVINEVDTIDGLIISGDPQVTKVGDIYVMFYFRLVKGQPAYNTFALSKDLVNWKAWKGEPLIKSEYEWENRHAHKSCVIKEKGVVYHYYCAVNDKNERFIALATSKEVLD